MLSADRKDSQSCISRPPFSVGAAAGARKTRALRALSWNCLVETNDDRAVYGESSAAKGFSAQTGK